MADTKTQGQKRNARAKQRDAEEKQTRDSQVCSDQNFTT